MRTRTREPELLADQNRATPPTIEADNDAAHRLAARLAQLNLDAETLELLLAALASDVCDHLAVDTTDTTTRR